jgi:pectin methylesterase-like acyl-CoA thioesterase
VINIGSLEQAQARAGEVSYEAVRAAIDALSRAEAYIRSYANLDPVLEGSYVELLDVLGAAPATP